MNKELSLTDSISKIPGIGPSAYLKLQKKSITKIIDLLTNFPIRYEDYSIKAKIDSLQPGDKVTIIGKIVSFTSKPTYRTNMQVQIIRLEDNTGAINSIWFNQPYLRTVFRINSQIRLAGTCSLYRQEKVFYPHEYEFNDEPTIHTARLVPYYTETLGFSSKVLRKRLQFIIQSLKSEELTEYLNSQTTELDLFSPQQNFLKIHFPNNKQDQVKAWERVRFENLLSILISYEKLKINNSKSIGYQIRSDPKSTISFEKLLPFRLTHDQQRACQEIETNLNSTQPMNRLLMGEVGSGKTVVAAYAIYLNWLNKFQSVLLVPTDILAQQHYQTLTKLFHKEKIKIALLTAKTKSVLPKEFDILITTHALLFRKFSQHRVSLLIIDEQHKFGVEQRNQALMVFKINRKTPHLLSMSATPIPRSLALLFSGHLTISMIKELPKAEHRVKTFLINEKKRQDCYKWIENKVKKEKVQVLVICPLIEESNFENTTELKSVKQELKLLKTYLPNLKIEGIYSQHPLKHKILQDFINQKYDILITTSIIEAGMDIPNINIILIENGERFGLAQLHQMRGRAARGTKAGFCFVFLQSSTDQAIRRLNYLVKIYDGFKLSEIDLKLRGPGNLLGVSQHGFLYLTVGDLLNEDLLNKAKKQARLMIEKQNNMSYTLLFNQHLNDEIEINNLN